jgi:putative tryptophan/tyrosine transport system substrate-binding protein
MVERHVDALLVGAGAFLTARREHIVALAARHGLPVNYSLREFAVSGGLMSYGTSITEVAAADRHCRRAQGHQPFDF